MKVKDFDNKRTIKMFVAFLLLICYIAFFICNMKAGYHFLVNISNLVLHLGFGLLNMAYYVLVMECN